MQFASQHPVSQEIGLFLVKTIKKKNYPEIKYIKNESAMKMKVSALLYIPSLFIHFKFEHLNISFIHLQRSHSAYFSIFIFITKRR